MYPHRIRLRGPWECEPVEAAAGAALPSKVLVTLPCRWGEGGLAGFGGKVRYQRRFGWPARIDDHERVWLTFAGIEGAAEIWLNGQRLGGPEDASGTFESDVTALLQARNHLTVEVKSATDRGGLWGEVALEVRCLAYLRAVRAWSTLTGDAAQVHVGGELIGTSDRPLELYILLDGRNLIYATLEPDPCGRAFQVASELLPAADWKTGRENPDEKHQIRVELVNGATAWFQVEGSFRFRKEISWLVEVASSS